MCANREGDAGMPKIYTGRAPGVVPVNLTLDKDAYELLQQQAPAKKAYGRFISRLIYEHYARQQERRRLWEHMQTVLMTEE
jgi:hypothetical protein